MISVKRVIDFYVSQTRTRSVVVVVVVVTAEILRRGLRRRPKRWPRKRRRRNKVERRIGRQKFCNSNRVTPKIND